MANVFRVPQIFQFFFESLEAREITAICLMIDMLDIAWNMTTVEVFGDGHPRRGGSEDIT